MMESNALEEVKAADPVAVSSDLAALAGKYLTFNLAGESYGIEILKVQEIIGMMAITRVPKTSAFVRGVINLRGKVIPVIDLRLKLGLSSVEDTARSCIIVLQVQGNQGSTTMGIIVDEVSEVVDIAASQLEPSPEFGSETIETDYLIAMGKIGERVVMLLDGAKLVLASEKSLLTPGA